jgi:hypothetical protein
MNMPSMMRRIRSGERRCVKHGHFTLPCAPETAMELFTPEGERAWVPGWNPYFLSGAKDEVGAVWTTNAHGTHVTWVTVVRDADHVRYSRVSENGTVGIVDVRCVADSDGTRVHVGYDLTGTDRAGVAAVKSFAEGYDEMLDEWRDLTAGFLDGSRVE